MRVLKIMGLVCVLLALCVSSAPAQLQGKWGVGAFVAYTNPVFTFGERFGGGIDKWGVNASYVTGSRITLEAEFHHASMEGGALESSPFNWSPKALTVKTYKSKDLNPNSSYTNDFNSLSLAALWHFNAGRTMGEGSFSPYIVVGGGFYDHETIASNIVWPGQSPLDAAGSGSGLDSAGDQLPGVVMNAQEDTRTAVTANLGLGIEAFLTPTIAIDMRVRYHFILSELRPYDAWGLDKAFPLQMYDAAAGFKFYFWD